MFWQIVAADPACLSGESVAEFIRFMAKQLGDTSSVKTFELEGSVKSEDAWKVAAHNLADPSDVARCVERYTQIEWATLLLTTNEHWAVLEKFDPKMLANLSDDDVLLRCVDNAAYYVVTAATSVRDALKQRFPTAEISSVEPAQVEWPD